MKAIARLACAVSSIALVAGCASTLSGVGGSDKYACKAPQGVLCTSVAGVYANSVENNLPGQRVEKRAVDAAAKLPLPARTVSTTPPSSDAIALRSSPRVLRLWVAPWEDSDGDLHEQSYLYVVVDSGRWLMERNRSAIRDEFMPIASPRTPPPVASEGTTSGREPRPPLPFGGMVPPAAGTPVAPEEQADAR